MKVVKGGSVSRMLEGVKVPRMFYAEQDLKKDTLHLGEIMLSEAYYPEVLEGRYPGLRAVSEPEELQFDAEDALKDTIRKGMLRCHR